IFRVLLYKVVFGGDFRRFFIPGVAFSFSSEYIVIRSFCVNNAQPLIQLGINLRESFFLIFSAAVCFSKRP
ncbi:MAG: hypothetical protein VB039_05015, partial [Oscillospiraceae bacterium]|nr:hypothetical protein [Oscillospiraceae bacterium]